MGCSLPPLNSGVSRSGLAEGMWEGERGMLVGFPETRLLQHSESFQNLRENNAYEHMASHHTPGKPTTVGRTTSRSDLKFKIGHTDIFMSLPHFKNLDLY